jgi:hypothetical protein
MVFSPEQQKVIDYITAYLGGSVICVELGEDNIAAALSDAETWMLVHMAPVYEQAFNMVSGQSEYQVNPDVDTVVDVAFPKTAHNDIYNSADIEFYGPIPANIWSGGSGSRHLPQSGWYQLQQMAESSTRVLSNDPTWIWNRATRRLILRPATTSGKAIYWYTTKSLDYQMLSIQQDWLLRRYAAAQSKMILGNIRSKYSEYPSASGTVQLNGSDLVSQAQEEIMTLEEKIKMLAVPMAFITG